MPMMMTTTAASAAVLIIVAVDAHGVTVTNDTFANVATPYNMEDDQYKWRWEFIPTILKKTFQEALLVPFASAIYRNTSDAA